VDPDERDDRRPGSPSRLATRQAVAWHAGARRSSPHCIDLRDERNGVSVTDVVLPSRDDPVVRAASESIGGPAGRRIRATSSRVTVVLVILTAVVCGLGLGAKQPCRASAWTKDNVYPDLCYSDIAMIYRTRPGFTDNASPYKGPGDEALEYPVLTGAFMSGAAFVTNAIDSGANDVGKSRTFFDITVLMLVGCALATTVLIAKTAGRRPWDAALFALSPGMLLASFINWDLFAVALTAGFGLAWARRRPAIAGALLGAAIAAKFYPIVLLGPLFLLCLRGGQLRMYGQMVLAAVSSWLVVNLPIMLTLPAGWARFYVFSKERGASFGSPWYALETEGWTIAEGNTVNFLSSGTFICLCLGIAALALFARRRPRVGQLAFLVVAAFAMTNKVYSPQYVLWMIALFPLARPRWRDFLIWQTAEVLYFVAVWWHLQGLSYPATTHVPLWTHTGATFLRIAATLYVCGLIVRDVLVPAYDPIRADGSDDPGGGPLDGAADSWHRRPLAPAVEPQEVVAIA
jgi:uncharacterized membrane protein